MPRWRSRSAARGALESRTAAPRHQPIYDWNAPLDLAAQALSWVADSNGELSAACIPVEEASTLARLDELRATDIAAYDAANARRGIARGLFVRDTEGSIFQVRVRDELPEHLLVEPQRS